MKDEGLSSDRLEGAEAIGHFLGVSERRAFHLLDTKQIPGGKQGGKWIASKAVLREHYAKLTRGQAL